MKTFLISIDEADELGMSCISLVENPAVEVDFLKFNKTDESEKLLELSAIDEDQHIITGVVALADTPIVRYNEELGYFNILFTKEVIAKMVQRYFKNGLQNKVNLEHQGPMISGVTLFESYIKDSSRGICPVEFSSIPDGSWLCSYKIENEELWNEIKEGKSFKGFSLEGYFEYSKEIKMSKEETYEEWLENFFS